MGKPYYGCEALYSLYNTWCCKPCKCLVKYNTEFGRIVLVNFMNSSSHWLERCVSKSFTVIITCTTQTAVWFTVDHSVPDSCFHNPVHTFGNENTIAFTCSYKNESKTTKQHTGHCVLVTLTYTNSGVPPHLCSRWLSVSFATLPIN